MNPNQRFRETMRFGQPDRIPLEPGWPRESTLKVWHQQGLPAEEEWLPYLFHQLTLPVEAAFILTPVNVNFTMLPTFEEKVLERHQDHIVVQDWMGAIVEISDQYDVSYLRYAKDFVTRDWHRFPVQNRQDWEEKIRWRYNSNDPQRLQSSDGRDGILSLTFNGPFWQMREWCGFEGLCFLMAEQPDFVQTMADFWSEFITNILERIVTRTRIDRVMVSEDMAYKAHSMISPRMIRRFILPAWQRWIRILSQAGDPVIMIDSDGYIGELLSLFIEAGFDATWPVEVAAGNDLVTYRRQYGQRIAFGGGIDKRALAAGGAVMQSELDRLAPVIRSGGYLPGCDHGVPPDISWPNFVAYSRRLAELTGWL
jgi:hypothetical protein